jgi:enoyl-CoA hydratase/carnithine racemase
LGSTHFLPRLLGPQNAGYLLLTGNLVSGAKAVALGLCMETTEQVVERAEEIAQDIVTASSVAVRATLATLRRQQEVGLEQALQREADSQAHCYAHSHLKEGLSAIREKRAPKFSN